MNVVLNLAPEITLTLGALALLTLDFLRPQWKKGMLYGALAVTGLSLWALRCSLVCGKPSAYFSLNAFTAGFSLLIVLGSLVTLVMAAEDDG